MPTYLITGGAGFIGSHLVEELLRRGEHVRVLDNFSTGKRENLVFTGVNGATPEIVVGDIRDAVAVRTAMKGVDYVLHQAALPSVQRSVLDPLLDLNRDLATITGSNATPTFADPRPGDVRHSMAGIEVAKEKLGYRPEVSWLSGL